MFEAVVTTGYIIIPGFSNLVYGLTNHSNRRGDHEAAETYCRQAVESELQVYEPTNPNMAYSLSCLGEALLGQTRPDDAMTPLGQAFDLRNRPDMAEARLAWTKWLFGRALVESGSDSDRGMEYVRESRTVFAEMGDSAESELTDVDSWLESRSD